MRLRDRLSGGADATSDHYQPHPIIPVTDLPAVRFARDLRDPVTAFMEKLRELGATAVPVSGGQGVADLVTAVVAEHGVGRALVSDDPEVAGVPDLLDGLGVVRLAPGSTAAASADLGVTGAAWAIAATGSLVLDCGRAGSRTAGLLPPVHLAFVPAKCVLPDPAALWRQLPDRVPGGLPSQLVLVTGPSRSADIELEITVGVHGPGTVIVGVLTDG
jgi:L-lactate dehydrogenase complex protein LldG